MTQWKLETKVGIFALLTIGLITLSTVKVGEGGLFSLGGYRLHATLDNAVGLDPKTPVQLAGIPVGYIEGVKLAEDGRRARITIYIKDREIRVPVGTEIKVRAKGFLGDTYLELIPGQVDGDTIPPDGDLLYGGAGGDINLLLSEFTEIAKDIKAVTSSLKDLTAGEDAPIRRTVGNLDRFAETIRELVEQNQRNINLIASNTAELTSVVRDLVVSGRGDVEESLSNVASITRKIDEGQGTVGQLINNRETIDKVNEAVGGLNQALGGLNRLQTEIGYHTEYLGAQKEFKHYVHLNLLPRPDEAFLLEFVEDRSASPTRVSRTSTVTAGGTTSTVTSDTETIERNKFRISAQLAKKFYDFTLRGGIIESRGGVGVDYDKGPIGLSASAFDFNTQSGNKPHLKLTGKVKVTPSLYLVGGGDDFLNPNQKTDWFVGAGIQLVDEDIKSLLMGGGLSSAVKSGN